MTQENPWADAANQAVGALYKYYLSQPTAADRIKAQYESERLNQLRIENTQNSRLLELGTQGLPGLSAAQRNFYTRQGLDNSAAQIFDAYVRPNMQVDAGDTKYITSGVTGLPIREYGVGVEPKTTVDSKGGRIITTPAIPSANRPDTVSHLMPALIEQESGGNPDALSPKGAAGIAQIMPDTARDPGYGVQPLQGWDGVDPRTAPVEEQLRFSRDYLQAMKDQKGSDELALAAYNAGPGAVQEYGGIPPFQETQQYVENIMGNTVTQPNGTQITPLPKSPADVEAEAAAQQDKNAASNVVNMKFEEALGELGSFGATGLPSTIMRNIPGTGSFDLAETLGTIKANLGFDKLQSMRESSPTGGALGQVSEFENKLLQAVFGSLEQGQSGDQLKLNMLIAQDAYNDIVHGYDAAGNPLGPPRHGVPSLRNIVTAQSEADLNRVILFYQNNGLELPALLQDGLVEKAMELGIQ